MLVSAPENCTFYRQGRRNPAQTWSCPVCSLLNNTMNLGSVKIKSELCDGAIFGVPHLDCLLMYIIY